MKKIQEFIIILLISFIGEMLSILIPLPVPGSVYGLVLMLLALIFKIIKIDQVRSTSKFLIEIMPIMFIPAGVGLMISFETLKPILLEVVVITIITTILVMGVSGAIAQLIVSRKNNIKEDTKNE